MPKWLQYYLGGEAHLCIFSPLNMLQVLSCLFSIPVCFQSTSMCLSPSEYTRRYLLGKEKISIREAGGAMAKSVTLAGCLLHAPFSFIIFGSAGKGFRCRKSGHFNGGSLANSWIDIFCVFFGKNISWILTVICCKVAIFVYIFNHMFINIFMYNIRFW